jgi:solute carrier family 45, member 1/2/4
MAPLVGAIADKSTSKWGRRRPFMGWGSVIVSIGLLVLGWTEEIVGFFVREETLVRGTTQIMPGDEIG